jgi:hypothetical protein
VPSTTELIGDLIQGLDTLLTGGNNRGVAGSGLSTAVRAVTDGLGSSQGEDSVVSSLTGGLLGGGAGFLAGLIRSLFGDDKPEPIALPAYEKPGSLFFEYDVASALTQAPDARVAESVNSPTANDATTGRSAAQGSPAVIVQVSALDAQSFAARSDDIASAVRMALARNHSLRDEIWED